MIQREEHGERDCGVVGSRSAREDFIEKAKLRAMSVRGRGEWFWQQEHECKGPRAEACLANLEQQGSLWSPWRQIVEPYRSLKDVGFYS